MHYDWSHSWYSPGDWALPDWWTEGSPARSGRMTHSEQTDFYASPFIVNVIGHSGGITTLPRSKHHDVRTVLQDRICRWWRELHQS